MQAEIWQRQYDPEVPKEIDIAPWSSLVEMYAWCCEQHAPHPAFSSAGHKVTFAQLDSLSEAFAASLQGLKLDKGDRVAVMMPNLLQYPVSVLGAHRAGCVVVNVNPLCTARELTHFLKDSEAKVIVIFESFLATLEKAQVRSSLERVVVARADDLFALPAGPDLGAGWRADDQTPPDSWQSLPGAISFRNALAEGFAAEFSPPQVASDDLAFLQFTGGTTGLSKGVMLSHGNMVANLSQIRAWVQHAMPEPGHLVVVTALPLYHIFALAVNSLTYLILGGECLLIANPRDFAGFAKTIKNVGFSVITGVNTLFNGLLNEPDFADSDFSKLAWACGGGMAVQEAVSKKWQAVTGLAICQGYGLSETSPVATVVPLAEKGFDGSVGVPLSNTEVSIRDAEGNVAPDGELGEICIRGPQVMQGYWRNPEATAEAFFPDGWFRSGDIGYFDERGSLFVSDRLKDMVVVSGFNVYPNEVEGVLAEHPLILEAAVVGVPSKDTGEALKACVVKSDPNLDADSVLAHCRELLSAYKVPKSVEFVNELPKSPVGKILRRELRGTNKS